jgi:nitrogen fixation NifU-like protein
MARSDGSLHESSNVDVLENPDRVGKAGNPVCWNLMEMFIKVNEEKIDEIIFRTFGCSSSHSHQ